MLPCLSITVSDSFLLGLSNTTHCTMVTIPRAKTGATPSEGCSRVARRLMVGVVAERSMRLVNGKRARAESATLAVGCLGSRVSARRAVRHSVRELVVARRAACDAVEGQVTSQSRHRECSEVEPAMASSGGQGSSLPSRAIRLVSIDLHPAALLQSLSCTAESGPIDRSIC